MCRTHTKIKGACKIKLRRKENKKNNKENRGKDKKKDAFFCRRENNAPIQFRCSERSEGVIHSRRTCSSPLPSSFLPESCSATFGGTGSLFLSHHFRRSGEAYISMSIYCFTSIRTHFPKSPFFLHRLVLSDPFPFLKQTNKQKIPLSKQSTQAPPNCPGLQINLRRKKMHRKICHVNAGPF